MYFSHLAVYDFRNLTHVKLNLIPQVNYFFGENGSGKTSLLEAIYYLTRGRSFRTHLISRLIHTNAEKFTIFGETLHTETSIKSTFGAEKSQASGFLKRNGENTEQLQLLSDLPTLLINTNSYSLLEDGPHVRRQYLDWLAFYISDSFFDTWKRYYRSLKQRNALLKARDKGPNLTVWSQELSRYATQLNKERREICEILIPTLQNVITPLLPLQNLKIDYFPGWDDDTNLFEHLQTNLEKDLKQGFTHLGPHRADLKFLEAGKPIKDLLSRGQQKLFVCGMILAQGALLKSKVNKQPIYLIDDLPSELDKLNKEKIMKQLLDQKTQIFLTAVEPNEFKTNSTPLKMFHVEHGSVREVVP